jgi:hypothetical protein
VAASDGDAQVHYALAVIQIKHRRYPEAVRLLDQAIELAPDDPWLRRARAWMCMPLRKHEESLPHLEALARLAPAEGTDDDAWPDAARFLGRMFGFLEGPAARRVPPESLRPLHDAVEASLSPSLLEVFERGRQDLLAQYDELAAAGDREQAEARAAQQEGNQRTADRLAAEREDVARETDALADQSAEAQAALDATLAEVAEQMAPLDDQFARLSAAAAQVGDRIRELDFAIARVLRLADEAEDPVERSRWLREADRLAFVRDGHRDDYAALDIEARRVNSQRAALETRRRAAIGEYQARMDALAEQGQDLRRTERRIAADERGLDRPVTGRTPRVRMLSTQAGSISTYEPFPLEAERQRLVRGRADGP